MKLSEIIDAPANFGPTKRFVKFYGRYCGPGNCGGDPIDVVDEVCREHDICYFTKGRNDPGCDSKLVHQLKNLLQSKLTAKQRLSAKTMLAYFSYRGRRAAPNPPPVANA